MATWSIVKKLFVGTGALVLLLLVSGVVSFQGSSSSEAHLDTVLHRTVPKLTIALQIQENAIALRGEQRRVLLAAFTQEPQRLEESAKIIDDVTAASVKLLDEISPLLSTEEGKQLVAGIRSDLATWGTLENDIEKEGKAGRATEAWAMAREKGQSADRQRRRPGQQVAHAATGLSQDLGSRRGQHFQPDSLDESGCLRVVASGRRTGLIYGSRGCGAVARSDT